MFHFGAKFEKHAVNLLCTDYRPSGNKQPA